MAVPIPEKTWQRSYNISNTYSGVVETDVDNLFILIKAAMQGFADGPMVTVGSSDSSTSNMSGTDLLTTVGSIVHSASAHSWYVGLMSNGSQVCWDFVSSTVQNVTITWSPGAAFTGGSTTAAPTAADSQTLLSNAAWVGSSPIAGIYVAHVMQATDSSCTRVYIFFGGTCTGIWMFDTASAPVTGWSPAVIAVVKQGVFTNITLLDYSSWLLTKVIKAKGTAANAMDMYLTGEGYSGNVLLAHLNAQNEISGENIFLGPCGLWHEDTTGQRGRHGYVPDLYFGINSLLTGDTWPEDSSKLWTILGDMYIPSGGLTMHLG